MRIAKLADPLTKFLPDYPNKEPASKVLSLFRRRDLSGRPPRAG